MNTLAVSLHTTTKHTNGINTMNTQGRWGGRSCMDGILKTQSLVVWTDSVHRDSRHLRRDEEVTAEGGCHFTQPLLGEVFQIEGGAR